MFTRNIFRFIFFISCAPAIAVAQSVHGEVMGGAEKDEPQPLPGANVYWAGSTIITQTDDNGQFSIDQPSSEQYLLVATYVGYLNDTINIQESAHIHFVLEPTTILTAVVVEGNQSGRTINTVDPIGSETLTKKELLKAACCNLSESFETNNTVDAEFGDAVTGAKTIKLLGLDGVYAQIMTENMPNVRGLASSYGLNFIPGTWIESIQITKGPGSVVNGYEGITGAINVSYLRPYDADEESGILNVYASHFGRFEGNAVYKHPFNLKWSTAVYAHGSTMQQNVDHNADGFIDMPKNNTLTFMNNWNYFSGKKHEGQYGIKYTSSDITGGQVNFNPEMPLTTENGYGIGMQIKRLELHAKNGFIFKRPGTSIGTIAQFTRHEQNGFYGLRSYTGAETYAKADAIFVTYIGNTNHTIKTGLNFIYNDFTERFDSMQLVRVEQVPGVFAEYHYAFKEQFSLLAGLRVDAHNLYGTLLTPRLHLKYNPSKSLTVRASVGKGYHAANVFAENTSWLASNREIVIAEELDIEEGWNYGLSLIHKFTINKREGTFTVDLYRTDFVQQTVVDLDASANSVEIYNLQGQAFTQVIQAEIEYNPIKRFDVRVAYKYVDSKSTYGDALRTVPLTFTHRGLVNLAYNWKRVGLSFDYTTQFYGSSRLPDLSGNHAAHDLGSTSAPYLLMLAQVTKKFDDLEVYLGSENITNYTQHNPIIAADEPFGDDFDAGVIYAPLMPRLFYIGARYTLHN